MTELKEVIAADLEQEFLLAADPQDAQTLLFAYPSNAAKDTIKNYVRPVVRLEFGARGVQLPAEDRNIKPYVSEAIEDLIDNPNTQARVLGIERTFWEKATIRGRLQEGAK